MFGSMQRGVNAYAKVGLETSVISASPHKLIVLLYDGALAAIKSAANHMAAGRIAEKGEAIGKALDIINNGLRASLDKKGGGEIAANLDSLYVYMAQRLLTASAAEQDRHARGSADPAGRSARRLDQIGEKPRATRNSAASHYPVLASA